MQKPVKLAVFLACWAGAAAAEPLDGKRQLLLVGQDGAEVVVGSISFEPRDGGTRVTLTHHGWDALGDDGQRMRDGYNAGWVHVFETCFANACKTGVEA